MDDLKIKQYGDELYEAFVKFSPVRPLLEREPDITIEDAYKIQEHFVARRVAAGDGEPAGRSGQYAATLAAGAG